MSQTTITSNIDVMCRFPTSKQRTFTAIQISEEITSHVKSKPTRSSGGNTKSMRIYFRLRSSSTSMLNAYSLVSHPICSKRLSSSSPPPVFCTPKSMYKRRPSPMNHAQRRLTASLKISKSSVKWTEYLFKKASSWAYRLRDTLKE